MLGNQQAIKKGAPSPFFFLYRCILQAFDQAD
jgi:hypothetical protein